MRRAFSLLLALLLLALPLAACTAEREETEDGLQIVATNFPLYDFARCVAGEDASVRLLLSPGAEPARRFGGRTLPPADRQRRAAAGGGRRACL